MTTEAGTCYCTAVENPEALEKMRTERKGDSSDLYCKLSSCMWLSLCYGIKSDL